MISIENLKEASDKAWHEYERIKGPYEQAYKKWEKAYNTYKERRIYEKAKQQVMRELVSLVVEKTSQNNNKP